jgi:putative addiction module component (TIGR02574 family)
MPLNIDDIKKLPDREKLQLIDELLESIDDNTINEYLNEEEDLTDNILKERWELYQSGKMKFSPFEEAIARLRKKSEERNNKKR